MSMGDTFYLIYYFVFAVASTLLAVEFFRMGNEKVPAIVSTVLAVICWFGFVVNVAHNLL